MNFKKDTAPRGRRGRGRCQLRYTAAALLPVFSIAETSAHVDAMRKVGSCILVACAAFVVVGECGAPAASSRSGGGDLAAAPVSDARTGGAMVEATQKFTDFMLAAFVPQIEEAVKAVQIPDIGGKSSGFDYHVTGMSIRSVDFSRATVAFKETQGLAIHFPFSISIGGSWNYKLHSIPHVPQGKGSFTAGAGANSHLDVLFVVGAKDGKPTVSVIPDSLQCSLDLQVHTSGSLFSWLYNLIVKAFKGKIKSQICSAATGSIPSIVNGVLGPTLAALDLTVDVPLPPVMQRPGFTLALDLQFSSPPIITSSSIAVPIRSELINAAQPKPATLPPALPVFGAGETSMLSAEVESWAFNRALAVFHGAGFYQYTVLPTALPADSPVQLTTKAFAPFAPGLATMYPDSKPIEVFVNVTAPPTMSLSGGKLILTGPTSFGFNVVSGNASSSSAPAFTLHCPLSVG